MWGTECLLVLLAMMGTVHSWDIAVTKAGQLQFYTNKNNTNNVGTQVRDLTALAYDAVHNMLLFVDLHNDNASIFTYSLETKKYQALVRKSSTENIQGIAFDAVTNTLFWTDAQERSIFSLSLKPGSTNEPYGNLVIQMDDEYPRAIAVDSCRGYIYWTNANVAKATIERARFDGSERQVVIEKDIDLPVSIAIDQHEKKLFWADDKEGIHFTIESSDLEGNNREVITKGINHSPNALTVSKDSIYWIDLGHKSVWKLPKNTKDEKPEQFIIFDNPPHGIVANYRIEDQTEGVPECEVLRSLSQNRSAINDSFSVPPDAGLFCVHGVKVEGKLECKCSPGYIGHRCATSVCQNFCVQGDCIIVDGKATCSCKDDFTGERCEKSLCDNFCLNNGYCFFNEEKKPVCRCGPDFEGPRCQLEKVFTTTTASTTTSTTVVTEPCNCTQNSTKSLMYSAEHQSRGDGEFVMPNNTDGWDPIRDPVIMALGIFCGMLCLACAVLITKILQLKKRPRIKKRFVVNKNVTPMTARPDQCEITIENCCNMNICETPCFEPRTTIRPTLLDAKPGKEEKKNLIANMEYPDDY